MYKKLYSYNPKPTEADKEKVCVRRMGVSPQVLAESYAIAKADKRPRSERPTQRDIILQIAQKGIRSIKRKKKFSFSKVEKKDDRVFWLPWNFHAEICEIVESVNSGEKYSKDTERKISMMDVWDAAITEALK